ncbi:MAG: threonine synthase [Pseudomonadota bacterium]
MRYVSTRGQADPVDFVTACLNGLAPDGGLYVPEEWPQIAPAAPNEPYVDVATRVISAMAGDALEAGDVRAMCERAYASFSHPAVAPLVQTGTNQWLMELHHGPTLAFKDVAMQLIGQLYDHALTAKKAHLSVVCATSGDTGGAAAAAFAGLSSVSMTILHPHGRIAPVQRLFMTTTGASNVQNLALHGDFDDCQAIVKDMFADKAFTAEVGLSGVNSINWMRIAAQSVYYATAQAALGPSTPVRFVVPSGNMGDAFAGYVAARCGLLGGGFEVLCAVNQNKALAELLGQGVMRRTPAVATPSPAMDITVPSNFERLLFEASSRNDGTVRDVYANFAQAGKATLPDTARGPLGCMGFSATSVNSDDILKEIARFQDETGWLICPHTAVGTFAARHAAETEAATVVLATAHAAKFPEIIEQAVGFAPYLPRRVAGIDADAEVFETIPAEPLAVREAIATLAAAAG